MFGTFSYMFNPIEFNIFGFYYFYDNNKKKGKLNMKEN